MNAFSDNYIKIAIDVMGGDHGLSTTIPAVLSIISDNLKNKKNVHFYLYGDEEKIKSYLIKHNTLIDYITICHADDFVSPDDKPSFAVRNRKQSGMYKALMDLRRKGVDAVVSSGNTGALMAISKIMLGTLVGINRPALVGVIPHKYKKGVIVLDFGADIDADSETLVQFAIMGSYFCRQLFDIDNPRVSLLNIGTEDIKGKDSIKKASDILSNEEKRNFNFIGYIEPSSVFNEDVDVMVTDGFTGNIFLKSIQGAIKYTLHSIKENIGIFSKIVIYFLLFFRFKKIKRKIDASQYNGAMFVGLNGIVIKSYGSADVKSFKS
ncbi:MAG: phosphate acyltransferase PlsX, partial [Anaplasmataceae bacterium]|nr:phosphate acyltransferase PlsX [Anaplasmataceae bacterium]